MGNNRKDSKVLGTYGTSVRVVSSGWTTTCVHYTCRLTARPCCFFLLKKRPCPVVSPSRRPLWSTIEDPWDLYPVNGVRSSTVIPHDPYAESLALIHAPHTPYTPYTPYTPHGVKDVDGKEQSGKRGKEAERSRSRRHKRKATEKQIEERIAELQEQLNAANALLKSR